LAWANLDILYRMSGHAAWLKKAINMHLRLTLKTLLQCLICHYYWIIKKIKKIKKIEKSYIVLSAHFDDIGKRKKIYK
jgi:hypothetical protein